MLPDLLTAYVGNLALKKKGLRYNYIVNLDLEGVGNLALKKKGLRCILTFFSIGYMVGNLALKKKGLRFMRLPQLHP